MLLVLLLLCLSPLLITVGSDLLQQTQRPGLSPASLVIMVTVYNVVQGGSRAGPADLEPLNCIYIFKSWKYFKSLNANLQKKLNL